MAKRLALHPEHKQVRASVSLELCAKSAVRTLFLFSPLIVDRSTNL